VVKEVRGQKDIAPEIAIEKNMLMRSFRGYDLKPKEDYVESRVPVLVNSDCYIEITNRSANDLGK
jgi:homogentisate 1,2-dioxygenase